MKLKGDDVAAGVVGTIKSVVSRVPLLGEMIAGWDAYPSARFERETQEFLKALDSALVRFGQKLDPSWFATLDGEKFARKVLDCAVDAQLADKKELFANALVNGAVNANASPIEKLKFVDMLRQMSLASLMVLADIHSVLSPDVRGAGREPLSNKPYPLVDPKRIAERLSPKYGPYLVESAMQEMQSQGLFSSTGEWTRQKDGSSRPGRGFADALTYTDFTCRFVEFITVRETPVKT
jgi:hypothetical protein